MQINQAGAGLQNNQAGAGLQRNCPHSREYVVGGPGANTPQIMAWPELPRGCSRTGQSESGTPSPPERDVMAVCRDLYVAPDPPARSAR